MFDIEKFVKRKLFKWLKESGVTEEIKEQFSELQIDLIKKQIETDKKTVAIIDLAAKYGEINIMIVEMELLNPNEKTFRITTVENHLIILDEWLENPEAKLRLLTKGKSLNEIVEKSPLKALRQVNE